MTTLKNKCKELGFSFSRQQAMSGSQYFLINGTKFRVSDHIQPSHYQCRNYFDVNNESDIEAIITNELFSFYANPIKSGSVFKNAIYDKNTDKFNIEEITEKTYNKYVLKMKLKKDFFINNGFDGDINF